MSDGTFNYQLKGENSDLIRKIEETTDRLNKQRDLVKKYTQERAGMAKAERRETFNALTNEEKMVRLARQRLDLERHLARAREQNNSVRERALRLSMARNQISTGMVGAGTSGAAGAFLGALSATGLIRGASIGAIFTALGGAAKSALSFADEMSDLAEQLGVSRREIIQITKAAGYAGASSNAVIGNLSTLAAARSAALSGDERSKAIFARYGVDPSQGNIIELAKSVSQGLGRGGMQAGDRGAMGQLFGRRPEAVIATLRNIQDVDAGMEGKIERLDAANARIDQFFNKVKEVNATIFASILQLADSYSRIASDPRSGRIGTMNGLDYIMSRRAPISNTGIGSGMADLRRLDDTVLGGVGKTGPTSPYDGSFRSPVAQADSLARMGLYIGGGPGSAQTIMRQQLTELKLIKEASRANNQAIRNL